MTRTDFPFVRQTEIVEVNGQDFLRLCRIAKWGLVSIEVVIVLRPATYRLSLRRQVEGVVLPTDKPETRTIISEEFPTRRAA